MKRNDVTTDANMKENAAETVLKNLGFGREMRSAFGTVFFTISRYGISNSRG